MTAQIENIANNKVILYLKIGKFTKLKHHKKYGI